ncbi:hypothetical protein [Bradyrhizobium sp. CCBAU 11361]|uniref:hypothetical protein n=1 Tax=Bradyrhizobium sp. CCBAU 11361 TaxID=1630812 RepID=UPI002FE11535
MPKIAYSSVLETAAEKFANLCEENLFEASDELVAFFLRQLVEILLTPFDGRQIGCGGYAEETPIRRAALERYKKLPVCVRHLANNLFNERLARGDNGILGNGLVRHTLEAMEEFIADIFLRRGKHLEHRPVVA